MSTGETDAILGLSERAQDDLAHLAKHRGRLRQIADATSKLQPGIGMSNAARNVGEEAGIPAQEAARILATILNLERLKARLRRDSAQFLRTMTASLESQTSEDWKRKNLKAWNEAIGAVTQFLDTLQEDHPLAVTSKAEQLGAQHENVFMHARILTDLRPVFNSAGDRIHETLVIQTLLVDYYDGNEPRRIAFALDARDVAQLRRLCERAEGKASALKAAVGELPWRTVIVGEEEAS